MFLTGLNEIWYLEAVEQRGGRPPNLKPETILAWLDVVAQTTATNYRKATQPAGMSDPTPEPKAQATPIPPPENAPPSREDAPGATIAPPVESSPDPEPEREPEGILIY